MIISDNELEVGKKYDNLKVMCSILRLEYKDNTCSRKALVKQIESQYKLERQGRSYLVLEKYSEVKEIEDKRKDNRIGKGKYELLMDSLLINLLHNKYNDIEENTYNVAFSELFMQDEELINIPIFTSKYKKLIDDYEELANKLGMNDKLLDMYREKSYITVKQCLESALNRLQKQEIILWEKATMVRYYNGDTYVADEGTELEIKEIEKEVENETGIEFFKRRNPIINKEFKIKVCRKITGLSSYWKIYKIEILDNEKLIEINNINEITKELTSRFGKSIRQSLIKHKYKFVEEVAIGNPRVKIVYAFINDIDNITKLNNMLLIGHDKIDLEVSCEMQDEENEEKEKERLKQEKEERRKLRESKKK